MVKHLAYVVLMRPEKRHKTPIIERNHVNSFAVEDSSNNFLLTSTLQLLVKQSHTDVDIGTPLCVSGRPTASQEPTPATSPPATSPPTPATPTNTMIAAKSTETKKKMSATELKRLMKEYGPVAVSFHASVFLTTLGGFFSLVDYGLDVASLVKNFPVIANNLPHKSAGNLALAWALTTVTGPVRGLMTVTLTPHVAKLWWGRGAKRRLTELAKDKRNEESS